MARVFHDAQNVLLLGFVPTVKKTNAADYCRILNKLTEGAHQKRLGKMNNVTPHTAQQTQQWFEQYE
jgi:hypothetical protein